MKRVRRISYAYQAQGELLFLHRRTICSASASPPIDTICTSYNTHCRQTWIRRFSRDLDLRAPQSSSAITSIIDLFRGNWRHLDAQARKILCTKVSELRDELIQTGDDGEKIALVLEGKGVPLFNTYRDGSAMVELLQQLFSWPNIAIEVFNWRRAYDTIPVTSEEYSKGITLAGRMKNADLALELFTEAANKQIKTTSTYNALMGAYMFCGFSEKCQLLFRELKREATFSPTIVTYNILISVFGRLMLVDHMEETLQEVKNLNLYPNVSTYNNLIAGYVIAWMWDRMEETYLTMKASCVMPDLTTYLLLLRGYAHSGNLQKMEEIYELIKDHVDQNEIQLIRAMICAYCKSSNANRVQKIEALLKLIPDSDYRPWLNVLLIKLYARVDMVEGMENSIKEAFEHNTAVYTAGVMRCIIASYFRNNAVDRLADFVKRAEDAGWRICRSLYHSKMVMYGSQNRLAEMESVLDEMENVRLFCTKKTFYIMYNAYSFWGQKNNVEKVLGLMFKHGYGLPSGVAPL